MASAIRWRRMTTGTIRWKPSWRTTPTRGFCTLFRRRGITTCGCATYRARAARKVAAVRHDDFAGEIKLAVENLPAGYTASEALIAAGQNEGRLTITSPAGAAPGVLSPVITGMAAIGKDTVMRRAESAESLMQAFAYTHVPVSYTHLTLPTILRV